MKARTVVKVFSWAFMVMGILGMTGAFLASSFDDPNWAAPLTLVGFAMTGFCFLAYLDRSNPG